MAYNSPLDLLITHARIWTAGATGPLDGALGVAGSRIAFVAPSDVARLPRSPGTRTIDAAGRFLMPGFHDAHVHLMGGGAQLDSVALKDAGTPEEFARRIADRARTTIPGEWVTGGEWDEQRWPAPELPRRQLLDHLTPGVPVFVLRHDWHMALANGEALRQAGITASTPSPPGGVIARDERGEPTGILKDAAMGLVARVIPPPTAARRERTLRRALAHMASLGVTSVQDMGPDEADVEGYRGLAARGELTARIRAVPLELHLARQGDQHGTQPRPADDAGDVLRVSGAKGFADGSLGSATAFFFEPYADAPGAHGLLSDEMQPLDEMRRRLIAIDASGGQLCIHGIGDRAVSMVLDLFEDVQRVNGPRDRRPRIEHSQHVLAFDVERYRELGVVASVQPYHAVDDGRWAEKRIGAARLPQAFRWRSFLDHGVRLACGTDWPVAPLDPVLTLQAAVTRATLDGRHPGGWVPTERLTVAEALEAYTLGAAYAAFEEGMKGTLEPGRLADLVLLDRNPFEVEPEALGGLRVDLTVMGGRVVFERGATTGC